MRQECQKMFLFSYLNFMHIGKIMYFDNLQNFLIACKSFFCIKKVNSILPSNVLFTNKF